MAISDVEHNTAVQFKKYNNLIFCFIILAVCAPLAYILGQLFLKYIESEDFNTSREKISYEDGVVSDQPFTNDCKNRIVGYHINWETPTISVNQLRKLTHVILRYVKIHPNRTIQFVGDKTDKKFAEIKRAARKVNPQLKVMIGVGDWDSLGQSQSSITSLIKNKETKRVIQSITSFVALHDIDGIDVFWTYSWRRRPSEHIQFINELREKLTKVEVRNGLQKRFVISLALPAYILNNEYRHHLNNVISYVDFITPFFYNLPGLNHGKLIKFIGPTSPLYGGNRGNVDETMKYYACTTKNLIN
ncbi:hypothetical protein GCK72_005169 [Caenorhabditis remanei]|uniref:GH18 domain-containing protein n=1 Tax=Caenorhabditis remanei TaxID=31234 RepID=A0A6A5HDK0_CAERE|nr:hypothetical protein GCK72_005169 [Caenorhabditis remanei]KAF1765217.1 hypothetical protein GCK72_005169 [Caenorhabditis remanei]